MRVLCMKNKHGFWISNISVLNVIYTYLFTNDIPEDYLTTNMDEAKHFNWFTYGFVKFMLDSYDIYVREAFIQNFKT